MRGSTIHNHAATFAYAVMRDGGATLVPYVYRPADMTDGYMVGLKGHERTVPLRADDDAANYRIITDQTMAYVEDNRRHWAPRRFLGLWLFEGLLYLDISQHYADIGDAVRAGRENDQIAIWSIESNTEVEI